MTKTAASPTQLVRRTARLRPPPLPEGSITVSAPPRVDSTPAGAAGWLQYLFPVVGSPGGAPFLVKKPKPPFFAHGGFFCSALLARWCVTGGHRAGSCA